MYVLSIGGYDCFFFYFTPEDKKRFDGQAQMEGYTEVDIVKKRRVTVWIEFSWLGTGTSILF
jgi:hypothetical protein